MSNRLITIQEAADEFDRIIKENGVDPKEFAKAVIYAAACACDEDEQAEARWICGLDE